MNARRIALRMLACATLTIAFAAVANAQATRTWVSGVGDDVNPCSRTAPCKTFAGAISKTAAGGEINALDPGGYGTITITKSMTIDGGATMASILACGTSGVNVNDSLTGTPGTIVVTLRNLSINGCRYTNSPGTNGIRFISGKDLNIINVFVNGFNTHGIDVSLNQSANARVLVQDTTVKQCAGDGMSVLNSGAGNVRATIERSTFAENGNGLHARSNSRVIARHSVFSNNDTNGVFSDGLNAGTFASASIWESQISGNGGSGVRSGNAGNGGSSGVTISNSQIDRNLGNGVTISTGGLVETFSNNSIRGNAVDGCGGCTPVGPGN